MPWDPDGRSARQALELPFDDVPAHLAFPLWSWCAGIISNARIVRDIGIEFRLQLEDFDDASWVWTVDLLKDAALRNPNFQLDLVQYLLREWIASDRAATADAKGEDLARILDAANSAYAVRKDRSGLEVRIDTAVRDQIQAVVDQARGSASSHLAEAWNQAYGRDHDSVKAYSEAIKAAEAALAPNVTPQNDRQTLGTMIADVRQAPQNFRFAMQDGQTSDGVQMVLAMMRQLWEGQRTRHGGARPTELESLDEARTAIHLAAALVQWGSSGAFGRSVPPASS